MSEGFGPVEGGGPVTGGLAGLLSGGLSVGPLDGFLIVANHRAEMKAITPDASKLWVREFTVPQKAGLDFWKNALRNDLIDHRGYRLVGEKRVRDGKGNEGWEMAFDVVVQGQPHRYLITIYALDPSFWRLGNSVRVVEFVAPVATFEKSAAVVRAAYGDVPVARLSGNRNGL